MPRYEPRWERFPAVAGYEWARRRLTSHRAHATIATQLFNAKQPLPLFELQAWLGPSSPHPLNTMRASILRSSRVPTLTRPTSRETYVPSKC
jgi:hypothetical protein